MPFKVKAICAISAACHVCEATFVCTVLLHTPLHLVHRHRLSPPAVSGATCTSVAISSKTSYCNTHATKKMRSNTPRGQKQSTPLPPPCVLINMGHRSSTYLNLCKQIRRRTKADARLSRLVVRWESKKCHISERAPLAVFAYSRSVHMDAMRPDDSSPLRR